MSDQKEKKELEALLKSEKAIIVPNEKGTIDLWTKRFFGLVEKLPQNDGEQNVRMQHFAACYKCKSVFSFAGTTSTLQRHKDLCSGKPPPAVAQTPAADRFVFRKPSDAAKSKVREACAGYCSMDSHAFSSVEGEGFKYIARALIKIGSQYGNVPLEDVIPSRRQIRDEVMKLAQVALGDVAEAIKRPLELGRVACTSDLYKQEDTSIDYLDLSIMWIDENFELHRRNAFCKEFPKGMPKTAENIRKEILSCLNELGIGEAIANSLYFTTDCAANYRAAFRDALRLDCASHRANTVLGTAWKNTEITIPEAREFKQNCSDLVAYMKRSSMKSELKHSLKSFCNTRWNSHFFLFNGIAKNYDDMYNKLYSFPAHSNKITRIDQILCQQLAAFLEQFKELSERMEADKVPTLQLVAVFYFIGQDACKLRDDDHEILQELKRNVKLQIQQKLLLHDVHWQSTFLDPGFRNFNFIPNPVVRNEKLEIVREQLISKMKSVDPRVGEETPAQIGPPPAKKAKSLFQAARQLQPDPPDAVEAEFDAYRQAPIPESENPLLFWKTHRSDMPRLAHIAAELYAMPASSAQSERSFSAAGRIINKKRLRLNPVTVDALMKVRSYMLKDAEAKEK